MSHMERVKKERNDLKDKIDALGRFIYEENGIYDSLEKCEKARLAQQLSAMSLYCRILDDRLCAEYAK